MWHCATHAAPATVPPLSPPLRHCSFYLLSSCRPPLSFGIRSMLPLIDCIGIHFMANYSAPPPHPLVSHLLCAPASHSPFHIAQHSRSTSRTNGSVAIIQFPYAKPVDILRLPQQMAQFNPPSPLLHTSLHSIAKLFPHPLLLLLLLLPTHVRLHLSSEVVVTLIDLPFSTAIFVSIAKTQAVIASSRDRGDAERERDGEIEKKKETQLGYPRTGRKVCSLNLNRANQSMANLKYINCL